MGFLKRLFGSAEPTDEPKKERHPLEESVNYYYPTSDNDIALMKTSVAGITHHMKLTDAPVVVQGHTRFEPENPYNKKAVALITDDGRQIGYIADRELSLYYDIFADRDPRLYETMLVPRQSLPAGFDYAGNAYADTWVNGARVGRRQAFRFGSEAAGLHDGRLHERVMFSACFPRFAFANPKRLKHSAFPSRSPLTLNQGVQGSTPCGSTAEKH